MLKADELRADPRVAEAKRLLLEAVKEHQAKLSLRAPHVSMDEFLQRAKEVRGAPLFFPYVGSGIGRGPLVELVDGSVKYDFIGGIGAHFGHSLPDLVEAGISAAIDDTVMQGNLQQTREPILFMERLAKLSGLKHCFLTTSGAMACENALKMAFQRRFPRKKLLAFRHCFMGRTCLLANVTDKPAYREGLPKMIDVDYVPFGPEGVAVLKKFLTKDAYAAMSFELIQGEGGFNVGQKEWLEPMMQLCKEHGVLVVVDEVQTFGRTSALFAYQHFGLAPYADYVTVGKMTQLCATLFNVPPKPGLISQTFTASTSAIYAANAILDRLEKEHLGSDGKNMQIYRRFTSQVESAGVGLMIATVPPKDPIETVRRLFDAGVIAFIAAGKIRFLIPGSITMEELDAACAIVREVLPC